VGSYTGERIVFKRPEKQIQAPCVLCSQAKSPVVLSLNEVQ
jgi:hypothetical protein